MIFNQYADGRKVRQFSLNPAFLVEYKGQQPAWGPIVWLCQTYPRISGVRYEAKTRVLSFL
jgi:hypothetical protein